MDYFIKYKKAKLALLKIVCQFYSIKLTKKEIEELNLNCNQCDKTDDFDCVDLIYHGYTPEGLYIWEKLGFKKPIYNLYEAWDLMDKIRYEKEDNINYYRESLELELICINVVKRNYKYSIDIEDAKKNKIEYDEDIDEFNGKIEGCDHYFEGAGETVWNLFDLEDPFVPMSKFYKIEKDLENKILKLDIKE